MQFYRDLISDRIRTLILITYITLLGIVTFSVTSNANAQVDVLGISVAGGESGSDDGELNRDVYGYIYPSQKYVDYFIGDVGLNTIRISARWERIQQVPGIEIYDYDPRLQELVDAVERVTNSGAYAIIDIHNYGRFISLNTDNSQTEAVIGEGDASIDDFAYLWQRLAETFKDNPYVMFELMNEPYEQDQANLMTTLQAAIDAIQDTGAKNTILVPGNRWSGAHSWENSDSFGESNATSLLRLQDKFDKLVFVAHQYIDQNYSGTQPDCLSADDAVAKLNIFTSWLRNNSRRGLLGEFGVSSAPECLESLTAMLSHIAANSDAYLGAVYWATGDHWAEPMEFYVIRPQSVYGDRDIGAAQLAVLKQFVDGDVTIAPPPQMGEIVDQDAQNSWYLPGDGRRGWINQVCADELEANGMPRRTGSWNIDLATLTGFDVGCSDIETLAQLVPTMGEIVDQNGENAWYLPGDGQRAWINQMCADVLEANGMPRRAGSWNSDLAHLSGFNVDCSDIGTPPPPPPPMGEIVDQNGENAWYLPGDGQRAWINQMCADVLEANGMPRRAGSWNSDLAHLTGFDVDCATI